MRCYRFNDGPHNKHWKNVFNENLDPLVRKNDLFKGTPFLWVGISDRYGIKNNLKIEFSRIGKKYGNIPNTIKECELYNKKIKT